MKHHHLLTSLSVSLLLASLLSGCKTIPSSSSSSSSSSPASSGSSSSQSPPSGSVPTSGLPPSFPGSNPAGDNSANTGSTTSGSGEVLSDEEYVAVLEGDLDASITVFDGMILDERTTVQGIEDNNPDQGFPQDDGDEPLFEEGDLAEGGEDDKGTIPGIPSGGQSDNQSDQQGSGTATDGNNAGLPGQVAKAEGAVPGDIKDGSDDDIVARQIREAALNETDPALREKLWDEYRKYKNQSNK